MAVALASKADTYQDLRRITEDDPDYQRLHAVTVKRLQRSIRQYAREVKRGEPGADTRFIHRHIGLMRQAYEAAHKEGQKDYWPAVSNRTVQHRFIQPDEQQTQKRLAYYALGSVLKMAHEVKAYQRQQQSGATVTTEPLEGTLTLADGEQHTGIMVAFMLKPAVAKKLALPNGEPADDLHLTLTFHGDSQGIPKSQLLTLRKVVADYAKTSAPLQGNISGVGRFNPSPSSKGKVPVIALVNVPRLHVWRDGLAKALDEAGWPPASTFAYTPHITLAYIDEDAEMPVKRARKVALEFDAVTLAIGGKHYTYELGGHNLDEYLETITLAAPTDVPANFANRTVLQGQVVWSGLQDGYADAGASDSASPYAQLYWNLGDAKEHCFSCPELAFGSPYDPPWAGAGSNQLTQSPGDGQTECGAACKCSLSYEYPDADALAQLGKAIQDKWNDWYPAGIDAEGNVLTQPITPPKAGSVLNSAQKAALDNFRNSSDMWDTVRRNLPPMPSFFGTEDLPSPLPAWEDLTAAQQAIVKRVEESHEQWLNAAGKLVPAPIVLPDPATEMRKWLAQASTGAFTPWWNEIDVTPSQEDDIEAWLDAVGRGDVVQWPTPQQPAEYDAMQKWLDWASSHIDEQTEGTDIKRDFRASEPEQLAIKLYNPNHDGKGRFTYGSGAATRVTKGQGRTRRGEGGKRVKNENYKGGKLGAFSAPGSTGGASKEEITSLLHPARLHTDYEENRRAVAKDLAGRLKGNADFQAMAAEAGVSPEEMSYRMVDSFFSNRSSGALDASQLAARDQFGLTGTSNSFDTSAAKAEEMYAAHPEAYRGFVQAQYDSTQEMFQREGITSVTAYRGIGQNDTNLPSTAKLDGGNHEIDITMRALSSWSVRDTLSAGYARNYRGKGMLMSADIPVSRILSTPITGWGVEDQNEIIVLGGPQHVSYRGFAGWDDRYEGFQR